MKGEFIAIMAWKPYASLEETKEAIALLESKPIVGADYRYYLALPYTVLNSLAVENTSPHLVFGATGMSSVAKSSFTGPIASKLLKDAGATFVLLGSAYARQLEEQDNATIRQKILSALDAGVTPLLCVGESLEELESGRSEEVLTKQLTECLQDFTEREWRAIRVIYEAPWLAACTSSPSWERIGNAYRLCRTILDRISGTTSIPLYCGVPEDILELAPYIEGIHAEGYYFGHANAHVNLFEKPLHLPEERKIAVEEPSTMLEQQKKDVEEALEKTEMGQKQELQPTQEEAEEESEKTAEIVGAAVLAAAHEMEGEKEEMPIEEKPQVQEEEAPSDEAEAEPEPEPKTQIRRMGFCDMTKVIKEPEKEA